MVNAFGELIQKKNNDKNSKEYCDNLDNVPIKMIVKVLCLGVEMMLIVAENDIEIVHPLESFE